MTTADEHAAEAAKLLAAAAAALAEAAASPDAAVAAGVREYLAPYLAMAHTHALLASRPVWAELAETVEVPAVPAVWLDQDGSVWTERSGAMWHLNRRDAAWESNPCSRPVIEETFGPLRPLPSVDGVL